MGQFLSIHKSNKINILSHLLWGFHEVEKRLFEPEYLVVYTHGIEQYLKNELSKKGGVIANLSFRRPGDFFWDIAGMCLPEIRGEENLYQPQLLLWKIFSLLASPDLSARYPHIARAVAHYLTKYQTATFALAEELATLFNHYMIYRPGWLHAWERGELIKGIPEKEQVWQKDLWNYLTAELKGEGRVTIWERLRAVLANPKSEIKDLPRKIYIFSITSMAPLYLELLHLLSEHVPVHLFLLSPSREDWMEDAENAPLLHSLGLEGRDFYQLLLDYPTCLDQDIYAESEHHSLLGTMQNDILNLNKPTLREVSLESLKADKSLQIHAAHSPIRELQILKNELIRYLSEHPQTRLEEIGVLSPNIEAYLPYVRGIFGEVAADKIPLAFSLADVKTREREPFFAAVSDLLDFFANRFDVPSVLTLLNNPLVSREFNLTSDTVQKSAVILQKINVSWGQDEAQRQKLGAKNNQFTWQKACHNLTRLLNTTPPPPGSLTDFPVLFAELYRDNEEPEITTAKIKDAIGRLLTFIRALSREYRRWHEQELTLAAWSELFKESVLHLIAARGEHDTARAGFFEYLAKIQANAEAVGFRGKLNAATFSQLLVAQMNQSTGAGFLAGGITFAGLIPLRTIPFKFVALIGMNEEDFPRQDLTLSFNLTRYKKERGDLSRREDDRYLFLETFMSAEEVLYISYVGMSLQKNEPLNPSPIVGEVIDLVAQMSQLEREILVSEWITHHPLQNFSPKYFTRPELTQYRADYFAAYKHPGESPPSFLAGFIPETVKVTEFTLEELQKFWKSPARAWLKHTLNWKNVWIDKEKDYSEPFTIYQEMKATGSSVGLSKHYNDNGRFIVNAHKSALFHREEWRGEEKELRALDYYPSGEFGPVWAEKLKKEAENLLTRHLPIETQAGLSPVTLGGLLLLPEERKEMTFISGGITLKGESGPIFANVQVFFTDNTNIKDTALINAYLTHLFLNAQIGPHTTLVCGLEEISGFTALAPSEAAKALQQWLAFTQIGRYEPLAFFRKISLDVAQNYLKALQKQKKEQEKEKKAKPGKKSDAKPIKSRKELLTNAVNTALNNAAAEDELNYFENKLLFTAETLNDEHPNFVPIIKKLLIPLYEHYQEIFKRK